MQIRAGALSDLDHLIDLDATIESEHYLHVDLSGEGPAITFRLDQRPLREKLLDPNAVDDDRRFALRQVLGGVEDGIARAVEHDGIMTALAVARLNAERQTLDLLDLRVDYDYRRQGLGTALVFQIISHAREQKLRAVTAATRTNNVPAAHFMAKSGFDLCGLDTRLSTNHDLVKEAVALFWYASLT